MARDLNLDLGSGHTAYRHASVVDLYVHASAIEVLDDNRALSRKFTNFTKKLLWADGHLRTALLGRLDLITQYKHIVYIYIPKQRPLQNIYEKQC